MKTIKLGGVKLENGVYVKPYSINVYDGDLHEMPKRVYFEFKKQMKAAAYIPTDEKGLKKLNARLYNAVMTDENNKPNLLNICSNLLSGLYQEYEQFSCRNHAFYCLIGGVTNFDEDHAKKKMELLYSHGLSELNTDEICEDVKKKLIEDYKESIQAYTKAQNLIKKSTH